MKTKRIIALLCAASMLLAFTACDSKSGDEEKSLTESNSVEVTEKKYVESQTENTDELYYSDTVYIAGSDIPVGTYLVTCTGENGGMDIIVFSGKTEYNNYDSTHKITGGEFRNAIETNAWTEFYLYEEETAFLRLEEGNIILLDNGICEFNKCDILNETTLYQGIYKIGTDVPSGKINIKFVNDYPRVTLFESSDKYLDYHKTDRLTNGDEDNAIENNSISSGYVYSNEMYSIDLENGMILFIQDGIVEYLVDKGPIIN